MVKTRRSVNGDAEADEREFSATTTRDRGSEEKCVAEWSQRQLRSNRYRVTRTLQRWPTKLVSRRRVRAIEMPRIMFPESDTEPEKYSRRSRPVRVFFEGEPATRRRVRPREPKNYIEDNEDKPIQQNVRRSGRQRKLLHHSFNESWITNELKVKGYPGLYGGCTSSDDCSLDDRPPPRPTRTTNGASHTDEEVATGSRTRRTSARCTANKKPHVDSMEQDTSEVEENQESEQAGAERGVKTEAAEEEQPPAERDKKEESEVPPDSESNQGPARNMRLRRQRQPVVTRDKKDRQHESGSDSETSDSGSDLVLNRAPRRSNRTRKSKPAYVEITERPRRQAKTYTIRNKPCLRERKPPKMLRRKTMRTEQSASSTSSSISSSDTEADLNVTVKNKTKGRQKCKSMGEQSERALREIQPIEVDGSVQFSSVGGLEEHIVCLREMVLFPLMYPTVFSKFGTRPARGVLFHGPPGTGKTLLARALANQCTQVGGRKVAFFMRKGADCLKKWVGESERNIKLLFQQANKMKPSIIFFDEIDALAPVRSARQDQVHTSVVGTLLAEVDGLCDRGEVIVIGATNRLDAVDPALRRAGRFDRELYFPPPHAAARRDILHIYTRDWSLPSRDATLERVAQLTNGYGGSDLKALCSEAVLKAFRRVYPQVYDSEHGLVIDPQKVEVTEEDLVEAMGAVVACGARAHPPPACPLPPHAAPLLSAQLHAATELMNNVAPHLVDARLAGASAAASGRVMLVSGPCAESHLGPALLATLDRCTVKELSLATLHSAFAFSHEQALISLFSELRRADRGSVLFVRDVGALWWFLGAAGVALFTQLWRLAAAGSRTLMLCTANVPLKELPEDCQRLFPAYAECVYTVRDPTVTEVIEFLRPLVIERSMRPPPAAATEPPPPLPLAPPPPPPQESPTERARRKRAEDYKLRELRIFLRDICRKLAANRRFYKFTKPVDLEEVTDYLDIIQQPMDLETMMTKVDMHRYNCAREFLEDIDLICANALEYNPDRTSSDKQIRHEACSLRDHAHALIEVEMDSDFEAECRKISRRRRQEGATLDPDLPSFIYTTTRLAGIAPQVDRQPPTINGTEKQEPTPQSARKRRRRTTAWSKGLAKKPRTSHKEPQPPPTVTDEESKENKPLLTSTPLANGAASSDESASDADTTVRARRADDTDLIFNLSAHGVGRPAALASPPKSGDRSASGAGTKSSPKKRNSGQEPSQPEGDRVTINKTDLENLVYKHAKHLRTIGLAALLELYGELAAAVESCARSRDRSALPARLLAVVTRYTHACRKT